MAITFVAVGNAAAQSAGTTTTAGTASITPTRPTGTAGGDRIFVLQAHTSSTGSAATPTDWKVLFKDVQIGTGTPSAAAGARYISCYYRDWDGIWAMPAFTLPSQTQVSHSVASISLRKAINEQWDTPTASGVGEFFGAAGTAFTATTASFTSITNAFMLLLAATNDNVTATVPDLTGTNGFVDANLTERADGGTATGNDVAIKAYTADVTTGATGTLTFTQTLSAASQGGFAAIQQTVSAAGSFPVSDDFTAADGVILTDRKSTSGNNYQAQVGFLGNFTIQNNRAWPHDAGHTLMGVTPPTADYELEGDFYFNETLVTLQHAMLVARADTGAYTAYGAGPSYSSGTGNLTLLLRKWVAGSFTEIGSYTIQAGQPTAGTVHTVKFRLQGNQLSVYLDGTLRIGPITDNSITAAGVVGIGSRDPVTSTTGIHIDNFVARNIPAVGTASGAYTFAGSSSGARTPKGTGSGAYTWAGSASGQAPAGLGQGESSGTYTWAGSASGARIPRGTANGGVYSFAGAAQGFRPNRAPMIVAETAATNTVANGRQVTFGSRWNPHVGDVVVLVCTSTSPNTITMPANYVNLLGSGNTVVASDAHTLAIVARTLTITQQNAATRTYEATTIFNSSTQGECLGFVLRGVDINDLVDAVSTTFSSTDTATPHVLPALAAEDISSDAYVVSCVVKDGTGTYTEPAGYNTIVTSTNNYQGAWVGAAEDLTYPGVGVAATNITPSAGDEYIAATIAFNRLPLRFRQTYDSGLSEDFQYAAEKSGVTRDLVADFGAVANNSGVDNRTAFVNAVAASSAGDEIYIPNGDYTVKGTANIGWKSGVKLRGQSEASARILMANTSSINTVFSVPSGAVDTIFEDFTIIRTGTSLFDACIKFGSANNTASAPDSQRHIIRNVTMRHFDRFAVEAHNTKHLLVSDCTMEDPTALDGGGSGYGVLLDGASTTNNWVRRCTLGPTIRHAIVAQILANHNLIGGLDENGDPAGNTVVGAVSGAIDMHGEIEYSNEISYNLVHDNARDATTQSPNGAGIEIGEPPTDETLGGSGHGRSGTQNWIHHNEVYNCPQGIRVMNQSDHTYIEDNWLHDNDDGLLIDQHDSYSDTGVDSPRILRNTIEDNDHGLRMLDIVTNALVQGNTIINNTGYGLFGDIDTTDYYISDNLITGNGTNVSLASGDGFYDDASLGTASGTYAWTSTATGEHDAKGTAGGTYTWAGTATGARTSRGTASGTYTWAGAATGKRVAGGTASGTYAWTSSAAGAHVSQGTASGTYAWAGTAAGDTPANQGSASGTYGWASTTTGERDSQGTAGGTYSWAATATGISHPQGAATGTYSWAGAASGKRAPGSALSGTYTWAHTITGQRASRGTGSGTYTWSSTAVGNAPNPDESSGFALGDYTWVSAASGEKDPAGTLAGNYGWASTTTGRHSAEGDASGAYTWFSDAEGDAPVLAIPEGQASSNYGWGSTTLGVFDPFGSAAGAYGWVGLAFGLLIISGENLYLVPPEDRTLYVPASDRTVAIRPQNSDTTVTATADRTTHVAVEDRVLRVLAETRLYEVESSARALVAPEQIP